MWQKENVPLLFFQLIGQFQFVLLRAGQHGLHLLEGSFILRHVLWRGAQTRLCQHRHRHTWLLSDSFTWSLPGRAATSRRSAPSPHHWCGSWPWPSRLAPGLSPPAAARCAAASPSGPPAAPWCPRSYGRNVTTSPSAEEGRGCKAWGELVGREDEEENIFFRC